MPYRDKSGGPLKGVEGNSLYLDDYRISGPKPWGGGTILKKWNVMSNELQDCIDKAIKNEAETK